MGGPVTGGKVHGEWPGLGDAALHEGRDLAVTTGQWRGVHVGKQAIYRWWTLKHVRVPAAQKAGWPSFGGRANGCELDNPPSTTRACPLM